MGLFDNLKQRFRGNNASKQTDPANIEEPLQIPESVSLSPLPKSISGMQRRANFDRLGMMQANQIGFQQGYGPEQKDFWEYKERRANGHSKADYIEMASHIPEVQERLNNGETLESLLRDDRLGACATQYFSPEQMIRVERMPDGSYEYADGGRHRIAAAQELGISIPVQVNEYGNKDGYSISPWEKQERFDAIVDYMKEHDYAATDNASYESDPEWQRLYKEYNHPVLKEENADESNWDRPLDTILKERYQQESIELMADSAETFNPNKMPANPSLPSPGQTGSLSDRYQSAYADRIRQTPSLESNRWGGERGESICAPQSEAARQILEARGIDGVQYQNGIPDFSPFSESTVKLGYMTDARHSQGPTAGRDGKDTVYAHFEDGELVSESHHADKSSIADLHMKYDKPGNFEQADALTAEQWTADSREGRTWSAEDVAQFRKDNGLTWHECNDMETMQMIPEAINADFGHLGGVGEVKETERLVDEALHNYEEEHFLENEDYDKMTPEEVEALGREQGHYDEDGVWYPDTQPAQAEDQQSVDRGQEPLDDVLPGVAEAEPIEDTLSEDTELDTEADTRPEAAENDTVEDVLPNDTEAEIVEDTLPEDAEAETVEDSLLEDAKAEAVEDALQEDTRAETVEDALPDNTESENIEDALRNGTRAEAVDNAFQEDAEAESTEDALPEEAETENIADALWDGTMTEAVDDAQLEGTEAKAVENILPEDAEAVKDALPDDTEAETVEDVLPEDAEAETTEDALPDDTMTEAVEDALPEDVEAESTEDALPEEAEPENIEDTLLDGTVAEAADDVLPEDAEVEAVEDVLPDDTEIETAADALPEDAKAESIEDALPHDIMVEVADDVIPEEAEAEILEDTLSEDAEVEIVENTLPENAVAEIAEVDLLEGAETETADDAFPENIEAGTIGDVLQEDAEAETVEDALSEDAEAETTADSFLDDTEENTLGEELSDSFEEEPFEDTAPDSLEVEDFSDFLDQPMEEAVTYQEDFSDLTDIPEEESFDDTDYDELVDHSTADYVDDSADYSDLSDTIDAGPYEEAAFDSTDVSVDLVDSGISESGGDSIE